MTAIRAAPTASRVRATITSLSLPLATLFSPNLLLAEWLADKWRFLFFASGLYRVWQRRRWTLLRNVWKLLSAFFFSASRCELYNLHLGVPYLSLDTRWENWIYKKKKEERGRRAKRGGRGRCEMKCLERVWRNGKEEIWRQTIYRRGPISRKRKRFAVYTLICNIQWLRHLQVFLLSATLAQTGACCFSLNEKWPQ